MEEPGHGKGVRGDKGEEKGGIKGYQVSAIGGIARKMDVHQRF